MPPLLPLVTLVPFLYNVVNVAVVFDEIPKPCLVACVVDIVLPKFLELIINETKLDWTKVIDCELELKEPISTGSPLEGILFVFKYKLKCVEFTDKALLGTNVVLKYALVPFGVTPVLAKVQPLLNVPVKLELFKFCAHAEALAPTIGYMACIDVHTFEAFISIVN